MTSFFYYFVCNFINIFMHSYRHVDALYKSKFGGGSSVFLVRMWRDINALTRYKCTVDTWKADPVNVIGEWENELIPSLISLKEIVQLKMYLEKGMDDKLKEKPTWTLPTPPEGWTPFFQKTLPCSVFWWWWTVESAVSRRCPRGSRFGNCEAHSVIVLIIVINTTQGAPCTDWKHLH